MNRRGKWSEKAYIFMCFILFCLCINTPFARSMPISPAGGNYLALDGEDDYAVLNSETPGMLLPAGTKELTVEAWVYPTSVPKKDIWATILNQQVAIYAAGDGSPLHEDAREDIGLGKDDLVLYMYASTSNGRSTGGMYLALSLHEWHHVAFQVKADQLAWICDNTAKTLPWGISGIEQDPLNLRNPESFVLGGYGKKVKISTLHSFLGSFGGCIDEVRISTIPRYDMASENIMPQGAFKSDNNTVALWHFNGRNGTNIFSDSSDNGYDLVGMNGATIRGAFAADINGKLATNWGKIKNSRSNF